MVRLIFSFYFGTSKGSEKKGQGRERGRQWEMILYSASDNFGEQSQRGVLINGLLRIFQMHMSSVNIQGCDIY